ncbi:MAG: EAL domain-containing protein [Gammaproteobacteria bacterium]|nr:EAL domain-containing protein [Gammaproteobacteria bacterium]
MTLPVDQFGENSEIAADLMQALAREELDFRLQPIVAAETGQIQGVELLLRWSRAGTEVGPDRFIPLAEASGCIVDIGYWVFEQACRVAVQLQEQFGEQTPYVALNLSSRQLDEADLAERLQQIMTSYGVRPERLLLEITESSLMTNLSQTRDMLAQLEALGLRLAVDDFGTGYSSLAQLVRLRPHTLKIDREFISGLNHCPESQQVVAAISRMARSLRLQVVAEGVETAEERGVVRAMGCGLIQGFLFHRPLSLADFLTLYGQVRAPAPQGLDFLIYISRAAVSPDAAMLQAILQPARAFNLSQGLSGFLFYFDNIFIQYLEGEGQVLERLYQSIQGDPRHWDVQEMARGQIDQRLFAGWEMGFQTLEGRLLRTQLGLADADQDYHQLLQKNPALCCSLFEAISQTSL